MKGLSYSAQTVLHRFFRLTAGERQLLLATTFLVLTIRVGLWLFSFATVHRLMVKITPQIAVEGSVDEKALQNVVWAVESTSRNITQATCLAQAYAAQYLLARRNCASTLRIGVIRGQSGQLEAHAWIEREGEVLLGDLPNLADYVMFPSLEKLAL